MSVREEAAQLDALDRPLEAARAYEQALAAGEGDLATLLDLAVLYFECCDGGYVAHHRLPAQFVSEALERANATLDLAEQRFGAHNEIEFWRYYFAFYSLGQDADAGKCEELVGRGPSTVPYFHLFALPGGERFAREAAVLWRQVERGNTARERHIRSIIASHANDGKWVTGPPWAEQR